VGILGEMLHMTEAEVVAWLDAKRNCVTGPP